MIAALRAPNVDFAALAPMEALLAGSCVVLLLGLARGRVMRERVVPATALLSLAAALGLTIWKWHTRRATASGAIEIDDLSLVLTVVFIAAAAAACLLALRAAAPRESAHGEFYSLLLGSAAGMAVLVSAQNLITLFVGLELLSIPLYVLCASEVRRSGSLESGLKYLIIGSVGSATLLYGLALLYGATGVTDFSSIAAKIGSGTGSDALALTGMALLLVGLAFKASVAPFHQWTPDVYEGAPTPITAFMAVATKAAALGVFLRAFDVALVDSQTDWGPVLATLAAITIVVGNVGALGQSSLKRMLAYSSVAQAGYMLAGVVVATRLGARATVMYLVIYLLMNVAAFAVIALRERETPFGDDIDALAGLGNERPLLAWPMTVAMLSLAGMPATAGLIGKIYLIQAAVDGGYAWLAVVIVIGSMISLGYYLRVIAAMWMRPAAKLAVAGAAPIAGGSPEADAATGRPELTFVAAVCGVAIVFFGIVPQPLFDLVGGVGGSFPGIF